MKNKLLFLLLQVSLFGCQFSSPKAEQPPIALPAKSSIPLVHTAIKGENPEYLDWKSIRLNGKFPKVTTVANINSLLGKADSVLTIDWDNTCTSDFRSNDSKLAYYGGYAFEQFGDSLDLESVDFRLSKNAYLQYGDLKLDASTTLEEIMQRFPNAAKTLLSESAKRADQEEVISLPPSKTLSDASWILMFQQGKLVMVDNWFPC